MLEYTITAHRRAPLAASVQSKRAPLATIALDTDPAGRDDAFNPAELLLASLAACMLKGIERVTPMLHFKLRDAEVRVHGVRQDSPPRMVRITYDLTVDTDESDARLELLHRNLRAYGTVYNTVASAVELTGTIRRANNRSGVSALATVAALSATPAA
jgi:uncharacterized OsmC-like protein